MKKIWRRSVILALAVLLVLPLVFTGNGVTQQASATPYLNNEKLLALTFDDGPGPYTAQLLDALKERDSKATFFLLGKKAAAYAPEIKRMKEEGHLIGSHTWGHERIQWRSKKSIAEDLKRTDDAIAAACGEAPRFFRPPHGAFFNFQLRGLDKFTLMWSYDTIDWKYKDRDAVCQRILDGARDGAVILLHDIHKTSVEGVIRAMDELLAQGYTLVRADELLQRNGHEIEEGRAYQKCRFDRRPQVTYLPFVISVKNKSTSSGKP